MRFVGPSCVCLSLFLLAGDASAANFSFTGTFSQDDQLELFQFTAPSALVTLETWSYAGGTNANGAVIPAGGFDPHISLFDATGGFGASSLLVASNNDGAGVATDPYDGCRIRLPSIADHPHRRPYLCAGTESV